ncbi:MAG TPA: EthD family reductase, partial [Pseudoalteromonas sp.]
MIKVSVLYPNADDAQFDFDYYCNVHIPLIAELLGDALIS